MARCPECSREIRGEPRACLYCGAALVDESVVAHERVATLLPRRRRRQQGWAVAILPGQDDRRLAPALSRIIGCEPFAASQLLRRPWPVILSCRGETGAHALKAELESASLHHVLIDYGQIEVDDARLVRRVDVRYETFAVTTLESGEISVPLDALRCVVVGRVEVDSEKEVLETSFRAMENYDARRVESVTSRPGYDAFTIFDVYGSEGLRVRLVESVCTIEGDGYVMARRGAGFTRFARWLKARAPELHVDEHYLQLGKEHQRSELTESGRLLAHGPFRHKEVLGTEEHYSGQGFDEYSVTAWTVWRLARQSMKRSSL